MEENETFLKYIYHEDLYLIDEAKPKAEKVEKIIEIVEEQPTVAEEAVPVTCFGNNERGILLLVHDESDDLLNQNDLDLLMKIVESGLKYSKNDFALVNAAKFPAEQILDEISYSYLISFGVDLSGIFSNTTPYTILQVDESSVLFSEALSEMHEDKQKKGRLWQALKSMFNIS